MVLRNPQTFGHDGRHCLHQRGYLWRRRRIKLTLLSCPLCLARSRLQASCLKARQHSLRLNCVEKHMVSIR
jgi:hypothetical protein